MADSKSHFLAITQDSYAESGDHVSAANIIKSRLSAGTWPLYANTKNRLAISEGDVLFFYVAGQGTHGGHTVARADVAKVVNAGRRVLRDEYATSPVSAVVELDNIKFVRPVALKAVLINCGVIQQENRKWGAFLMGGLSRVSEEVAIKLDGPEQ
jgi:predicted RNA-binding protein